MLKSYLNSSWLSQKDFLNLCKSELPGNNLFLDVQPVAFLKLSKFISSNMNILIYLINFSINNFVAHCCNNPFFYVISRNIQ